MGQPKKWGQLVHGSLPAWHDGACRVWTCLWMETTSIFFNESAFPFPEILNHGLLFEVDFNPQRTGHSVICERDGPVTGFTDKLTTLQPLSQPPFSAILWMLDTKSRSWARNSKWLFHKLLPASRKISNCFVTQNGNFKKRGFSEFTRIPVLECNLGPSPCWVRAMHRTGTWTHLICDTWRWHSGMWSGCLFRQISWVVF